MLKLTPQEREEIRQMHRSCRERKYADKLKALLLPCCRKRPACGFYYFLNQA